jgi:hypothetical protein
MSVNAREVTTMKGPLFLKTAFLLSSPALAAALATALAVLPVRAAEPAPSAAVPAASTKGLGLTAAGAAEDTLKACLARIPEEASAGQRMIAEQSCGRDEQDRHQIQAVPGR